MKSFTSKGYTRETFNWQYHYYYLTNSGIEYLRQYLALPADIVPATLKASAAPRVPTSNFHFSFYSFISLFSLIIFLIIISFLLKKIFRRS